MPSIGKVPTDSRPQFSQLMIIANNLDRGRSPLAGARQTLPGVDRYVLEEARRALATNNHDGPPGATPAPEIRPKSAASVLWPHLPAG
jgi:hypothetical protein